MKNGDKVDAIDDTGSVKYTGTFLGSGHPAESVGVRDRSRVHYAVQVSNSGDVVYLDAFYWSLRLSQK